MSKKVFIVFGPQGSGKGTQASMIARDHSLPNLSTGDFFRKEIELNTPIGDKVKDLISEGNLVPDTLVNEVVRGILKTEKYENGVVLDGYPRSILQAQFLNNFFDKDNIYVINIQVSDKQAIHRISGRLVCKCGASYHVQYNPPRGNEICDACGSKLFIRDDDNPETVLKRLKIYHEKTKNLLDFYKKENIKIFDINGEQDIDVVYEDIKKKINLL